jgi:hypothetical protein
MATYLLCTVIINGLVKSNDSVFQVAGSSESATPVHKVAENGGWYLGVRPDPRIDIAVRA